MDDPTSLLVEPAEPEESVSAGYVDPADLLQMVSPAYWIDELIKQLTGHDPIGMATTFFVGDWTAFAKCGEAYGHLADFVTAHGQLTQRGLAELDQHWDGNAGDAAWQYFSGLAAATSGLYQPLHDAADSYANAARGAWAAATQAKGIIESLIDTAIVAAGAMAVGGALMETGVGAVVGYGYAAYSIGKLIKLIGELSKVISIATSTIFGVFGVGMLLSDQGGDLSGYQLPAAPYASPVPA